MYLRYYDPRFGDIYELFIEDETGEFIHAQRSMEKIGQDVAYYDDLNQIPKVQRNAIAEHIAAEWHKAHKK